jgi:ribonuclease HI
MHVPPPSTVHVDPSDHSGDVGSGLLDGPHGGVSSPAPPQVDEDQDFHSALGDEDLAALLEELDAVEELDRSAVAGRSAPDQAADADATPRDGHDASRRRLGHADPVLDEPPDPALNEPPDASADHAGHTQRGAQPALTLRRVEYDVRDWTFGPAIVPPKPNDWTTRLGHGEREHRHGHAQDNVANSPTAGRPAAPLRARASTRWGPRKSALSRSWTRWGPPHGRAPPLTRAATWAHLDSLWTTPPTPSAATTAPSEPPTPHANTDATPSVPPAWSAPPARTQTRWGPSITRTLPPRTASTRRADQDSARTVSTTEGSMETPGVAPESPERPHETSTTWTTPDGRLHQIFAHGARRFACSRDSFAAMSFGELSRHRRKCHRDVTFVDHFHCGCACSQHFQTRLSAAAHASSCPTAPRRPRASTATTLGSHPSWCATPNPSPVLGADSQGGDTPTPAPTTPIVTSEDSTSSRAFEREHTTETEAADQAGARKRRKACHIPLAQATPSSTPMQRTSMTTPRPSRPDTAAAIDTDTERAQAVPSDTAEPDRDAPMTEVNQGEEADRTEWTLQFDGACRGRDARTAGAGALLLDTEGVVKWTASIYIDGGRQTNNTAEYQALLSGVEGAIGHGCTTLRIEGDSTLVIAQVKGEYACKSTRLRNLRNRVRRMLQHMHSTLIHIDRTDNSHADRLANQALDRGRSRYECADHDVSTTDCSPPPPVVLTHQQANRPPPPHTQAHPTPTAPVDNVESFPTLQTGPEATPSCRPRLRLRNLDATELAKAHSVVSTAANRLLTRLRDSNGWTDGEGILSAIAPAIYDALRPYSTTPPRRQQRTSKYPHQQRPQRTDDGPGAQHLNERIDSLHATQRDPSRGRRDVDRARRATARARTALDRERLRQRFERDEGGCVRSILATATAKNLPLQNADNEPTTDPNVCPLPSEDVYGYFEGLHTPRSPFDFDSGSGAEFRELLSQLPTPTQERGALVDDITVNEVEDQILKARRQSAPGHDGIGYDVLHRFREELLPLLHAGYEFCWRHRRLPASWKVGVVRLIHKKGSRSVPSNWRPICLQPTLYKVYASILARRFSSWLEANDRLTPAQKGFRAVNGCNEHNFISAMALDNARRRERALYMVWYDLENAFGSVPPELIWRVMDAIGVDAGFIASCRAIYSDSYYTVTNTATGATPPIAHRLGVYQGCPLSPFLFLVGVMPLVRRLHTEQTAGIELAPGTPVRTTAFADDIKTFSETKSGIEAAHAIVRKFLTWATMRANPTKCAVFGAHMQGHRRVADPPKLLLHGEAVPALDMSDTYRYLGIGDGFDHAVTDFQLDPTLRDMRVQTAALLQSGLRPAQIVKAIKTFIYPRVDYALRHVRTHRGALDRWDLWLRRGLRHLLRLPQAASTAFFYAPTSRGGLGLIPLAELAAAVQVGHAWQMLHAPDQTVQAVARAQITQIAQRRYRLDPDHWSERTDDLVLAFLRDELKNSPHATRRRQSHDVSSLWTDVQQHARRLGFDFFAPTPAAADAPTEASDATPIQPTSPALRTPSHTAALTKDNVMAQLKLHAKRGHATTWLRQTDQGRTVQAHGGHGSAFITRPGRLDDRDYRFAIAARLNQLPTRAVLKRQRRGTVTRCRQRDCTHQTETLAHVINHCEANNTKIRARHDRVLAAIAAKLREPRRSNRQRHTEIKINESVSQVTDSTQRPDIQVLDHDRKHAVIADLVIAFETDTAGRRGTGMDAARASKLSKYAPLGRALQQQGWQVTLAALTYGSLGSVHPSNFKTYTEILNLSKQSAKQLNRTSSLDCIRASANIWYDHAAANTREPNGGQTNQRE